MNRIKGEQLLEKTEKKYRKGILKLFFYGILALLFLSLIFYWAYKKNIFYMNPKKKIFSYLKEVQPLEDRFYRLVKNNQEISNNKNLIAEQEYLKFLEESILVIDEMVLDLSSIDPDRYMQENKLLFLEEMKIMRNMMVERKIGMKIKDKSSLLRSEEYLESYQVTARLRRDSLKNIFNKYGIVYIDLKNSIKYKTR